MSREDYDNTALVWTDTPVETSVLSVLGDPSRAISSTGGTLVYEDRYERVRQVVEAEFLALPFLPICAHKLLTSGTITHGHGTGSTVTTTAKNVRVWR